MQADAGGKGTNVKSEKRKKRNNNNNDCATCARYILRDKRTLLSSHCGNDYRFVAHL